jgi:hypothetical protein
MKYHDQIRAALPAKYSRVPDKYAAATTACHIERAPKRDNGATPAPAHP